MSRSSSEEEIKNAYRKLAKKNHPDLNPGNKAAETRFKEISEAYEMIGTPENRAKFDRGEFHANETAQQGPFAGRGPFYRETQQGEGGGRYTYHFGEGVDDDILSEIFGQFGRARGGGAGRRAGRGGGMPPLQGDDEQYQLQVDLRDATLGAEREVTFPNGKRLRVKIPAGVRSGSKLRVAGQGGPGIAGGPPGDAYIEIHVIPSKAFRVEGDDVYVDLPISISEAVLGGQVRVPTLDGAVMLKIPPGVNTDRKLRIPGKGLVTDRASGKRGDQYVILKVYLPDQIDPELREKIREWTEKKGSYDPRQSRAA